MSSTNHFYFKKLFYDILFINERIISSLLSITNEIKTFENFHSTEPRENTSFSNAYKKRL